MKNSRIQWIVLGLLALVAVSCQTKDNIESTPPLPKEKSFSARYIIPLTTGRDNGETTIINPANATATNIGEFKPVLREAIEAAIAGKVPTYPTQDRPDAQKDPSTFLKRELALVEEAGTPVTVDEMLVSLELEYDGQAFEGYSKMSCKFIDLTFVDKANILPDRNMARIYVRDLQGFKVTRGGANLAMPTYLDSRHFEHYVIRVYAPQDTFGIRTHAEARTIQEKLDQGILQDLNPYF